MKLLFVSALLLSEAAAATASAPVFPVRIVHGEHRSYLADQKNVPFFFNCDIAQLMLNRLRYEDVVHYLDTRKAQGYTAFWFIIGLAQGMTDDRTFITAPPDNAYGEKPFHNNLGDLSLPNRKYFDYVRKIVDAAADRGLLVGIAPAYVGAGKVYPGAVGSQALLLMKKSGVDGCRRYGQFIGRLFKDRKNVFWIHQGDQNAYNFGGAGSAALVAAVADGILSTDRKYFRIHTGITRDIGGVVRSSSYKGQFDTSGSKVNPMPWLNVNHVYVKPGPGGDDFALMLKDQMDAWHAHRHETDPRLPFFSLDGVCEHYNGDARANRAQAYYSLLSGSIGYFTGNIRICWFMSPPSSPRNWKEEMIDRESIQNTYIARLFQSLPWWRLIPDAGRGLLGGNYEGCAAAIADNGSIGIVYMPVHLTITVDLTRLSGENVRAHWFNPRTGLKQQAGTFSAHQVQFTPPSSRDNAADWVLLLEVSGTRRKERP